MRKQKTFWNARLERPEGNIRIVTAGLSGTEGPPRGEVPGLRGGGPKFTGAVGCRARKFDWYPLRGWVLWSTPNGVSASPNELLCIQPGWTSVVHRESCQIGLEHWHGMANQ